MTDFVNEPSSSAAIRGAALFETKDEKRHARQRRSPWGLLEHIEMDLRAIRRKLSNTANFIALHTLVDEEIGSIKGTRNKRRRRTRPPRSAEPTPRIDTGQP
jgi:hypothetical protein